MKRKKDKKSIFSEYCSNQVLRVVDLPTDVKVAESKANMRDGVLTLELPKVVPAQSIPLPASPHNFSLGRTCVPPEGCVVIAFVSAADFGRCQ